MGRSKFKGPFIQKTFFKSTTNKKKKKEKHYILTTWSRSSTILPYLVGRTVRIYNGKAFLKVTIQKEMIGHKLGEFAKTRSGFSYKKK